MALTTARQFFFQILRDNSFTNFETEGELIDDLIILICMYHVSFARLLVLKVLDFGK